jgi:hypothetical protein
LVPTAGFVHVPVLLKVWMFTVFEGEAQIGFAPAPCVVSVCPVEPTPRHTQFEPL